MSSTPNTSIPDRFFKPYLIGIFIITLGLTVVSCATPKDKQEEVGIIDLILKGKVEPINPVVFKDLINIKAVLPVPPSIPVNTYQREVNYAPDGIQWGMKLTDPCFDQQDLKDVVKACNFKDSTVRHTAVHLASNNPGIYNLGQLCDIFDYVLKSWKYVNDPLGENYVAKASETIELNYVGDCDDFAVLVGSMVLAIGGDIRINYAYNDTSGHAFVEANLGVIDALSVETYLMRRYKISSTSLIHTRTEPSSKNVWLNVDWFAKYPGGPYFGHNRGVRFYPYDRICETFSHIDDLRRYRPSGSDIYDSLAFGH